MSKSSFARLLNNNWSVLAQGATSLAAAIIDGFWFPPSVATGLGEQKIFVGFGKIFVVVIAWSLINVYVHYYRRHMEDIRWWFRLCLASALISIAVFFGYQVLTTLWTHSYQREHGKVVLIGSEYTETIIENVTNRAKFDPDFRKQFDPQREITRNDAIMWLNKQNPEQLLSSVQGNSNAVWTSKSLFVRRVLLSAVYLAGLPLFCIALMSGIQAAYLARNVQVKSPTLG